MRASANRRRFAALTCLALVPTLGACQAHMDLTVHEEGTYDAVIRMVDNTSSQITSTSQCKQLASSLRSSIATNKGSEIKVKSIKGDEGIGCEFTFKSIPVATAATKPAPNASAASTANASANANASASPTGATNALVWRQGNKIFVRIPGVNTDGDSDAAGASPSASTSTGANGSNGSAGSSGSGSSGGSSKSGGSDDVVEKYKSLIDTKLTVTFPGAVIDAGGGKVQGHKVTWSGPQILATGVSASGYAIGDGGMPWYSASRPWAWLIVGSVFALTAFGFWRRRRARS
ncbi:hypothetical protein [Actinomyces graevenitzii]|nr:hypothetical protein [Actinomyces graevenitzii]